MPPQIATLPPVAIELEPLELRTVSPSPEPPPAPIPVAPARSGPSFEGIKGALRALLLPDPDGLHLVVMDAFLQALPPGLQEEVFREALANDAHVAKMKREIEEEAQRAEQPALSPYPAPAPDSPVSPADPRWKGPEHREAVFRSWFARHGDRIARLRRSRPPRNLDLSGEVWLALDRDGSVVGTGRTRAAAWRAGLAYLLLEVESPERMMESVDYPDEEDASGYVRAPAALIRCEGPEPFLRLLERFTGAL